MMRDGAWVDGAIEEAIARGDFEDLPGAGKPLQLGSTNDPDWWIKQRIAEGDVEREALLPAVVLLGREYAARDETLVELLDEQAVREYVLEFNARVRDDQLGHPEAAMIAPTFELDETLERWRRLRAEREEQERRLLEERRAAAATARRTPWWRRWLG